MYKSRVIAWNDNGLYAVVSSLKSEVLRSYGAVARVSIPFSSLFSGKWHRGEKFSLFHNQLRIFQEVGLISRSLMPPDSLLNSQRQYKVFDVEFVS